MLASTLMFLQRLDALSSALFRGPRTWASIMDRIEHWHRTHKWSTRGISHELAVRGAEVSVRAVTR